MTTPPLRRVIVGDGSTVVWTSHWHTERGLSGEPCLSYHEGALLILLPRLSEHVLEQLPPIGTPAELWEDDDDGSLISQLLWFEAERQLYELLFDEDHWFDALPTVDSGRIVELVWYTQRGDGGEVVERRREQVQIGRGRRVVGAARPR